MDTAPYYGVLDLFAMSSDTEQMPIALLEAMASGLPALCTDVGDSAEILNAGAPEIAPRGDDAAWVTALRTLENDSALRQAAGQRNRERVERCYSLDLMIQNYYDLYRKAADLSAHKS